MLTPPIFLLLFVTLASILLGFFVLLRNFRNQVNVSYFFLALGIGLWAGTNAVFQLKISHAAAFVTAMLAYYAGAMLSIAFFYFTFVFPNNFSNLKQNYKKAIFVHAIIWFVVISIPGLTLKDVSIDTPVKGLVTGPGLYFYFLSALFFLGGGMVNLISKYRKVKGLFRLQIFYVLLGIFSLAFFGILCNVIMPLFGNYTLVQYGPDSSIVLLATTAYAIVRHQLMGIRVVVQRSAIYSVLVALLVSCYLGLALFFQSYLNAEGHLDKLIAGGVSAIVGAFAIPNLEKYFRKITDPWFFKDTYDYPKALYLLSETVNQNLELPKLIQETDKALKHVFKIEYASLTTVSPVNFFRNGKLSTIEEPVLVESILNTISSWNVSAMTLEQISARRNQVKNFQDIDLMLERCLQVGIRLFVKISTPERLVGFLFLSKKLSGDEYDERDIQLLETFSNHLAIALEKAEAYQQLKDYSENLEEKVKKRTEEIEKIQQMEKAMVEDLSHALQTPLTVFKANLGLLKPKSPTYKKYLQTMEKSVNKVSQITSDLLRLAHLESPMLNSSYQAVNLSELVNDLAEYVEVVCKNNKLKLVKNIEPNLRVLGDLKQLEELVTNLLSNAVKFSKGNSGSEIVVSLKNRNTSVEFTVADQGIGIAKVDLNKIFDRFFRSQNYAENDSKGTGLGLSICKAIVIRHGGEISVESELGKGATFKVILPLI